MYNKNKINMYRIKETYDFVKKKKFYIIEESFHFLFFKLWSTVIENDITVLNSYPLIYDRKKLAESAIETLEEKDRRNEHLNRIKNKQNDTLNRPPTSGPLFY